MAEENSFQILMRRIRSGDQEAATQLVREYEPAIRRAARVWSIDPRLRRVFDSMDICQSVFASFFVRTALGQYELETPEQLLKLLINMSRKKVADHARGERAARRDYRRVQGGADHDKDLAAGGSSPSQHVAGAELLQEFRQRLSADERELAEQRSLGHDWNEIAEARGANPDALRKKLMRAVDRVATELGLDEV